MKSLSLITLALFSLLSVQCLPVFDAELAASPWIHERHISYRGGKRAPNLTAEKKNVSFIKNE